MRKPTFASKKSRSATGYWKHARPFGKRMANKSERMGARQELMALTRKICARTRATSPAMVKKLIREAILAACIRPRKKPFQ